MKTLQRLEQWMKDRYGCTDRAELVRRACVAGGASMLLTQAKHPWRLNPMALIAGGALLAGGYVNWGRFFAHHAAPDGTPSFRDDGIACCQVPADEVDEAAMESFPASDPPAHQSFRRH